MTYEGRRSFWYMISIACSIAAITFFLFLMWDASAARQDSLDRVAETIMDEMRSDG